MKRVLIIGMIAVSLSACGILDDEDQNEPDIQQPQEVKMNMPAGLTGCKTFRVNGEGGIRVLITRCPHAETTTVNGKTATVVAEEVPEEDDVNVHVELTAKTQ